MLLKIVKYLTCGLIKLLLATRYKMEYRGREKLTPENLSKKGGILFLPNHTAEVDPLIVGTGLWNEFQPRPVILEWIIQMPVVKGVMLLMKAVPIPDFQKRIAHTRVIQADKAFSTVIEGLKKGENFLFYPAGKLKVGEKEIIGGASGLHKIIQANPEINIVLVRTTGLWGSTFSKGWDGKPVGFVKPACHAFLAVIKNGFFFLPKRKVIIEYQPMNDSFPRVSSKIVLNHFLENWYNQDPDPLKIIPYQFWSNKVLRHYIPPEPHRDVSNVPEETQDDVIQEIARISKMSPSEITIEMSLFADLRLDSLDAQEIVTYLEENYNVSNVNPYQLTTVASVMNYAAHPNEPSLQEEKIDSSSSDWKGFDEKAAKRASIYGDSVPEAFFRIACSRRKSFACADLVLKEVTYERLMLSVILMAKKIEKMPGQYIGVLLPASIAVNVIVIACQLAKKIPVMINWTVGVHHLEAVKQSTGVQCVISSDIFLKNIPDVDTSPISNELLSIEKLKESISLYEKIKTSLLVKLKYETLIKKLGLLDFDKNSPAVLLFTSGTETAPKGVPLSHENILFDMKTAFDRVKTTNEDVILGFLPPFHSYGFTVCGLLPLISGVRAIYYPNPTHYKKLARLIAEWEVTFLAGAPTFLKGILQPSQKNLYKSLRIIISGAEKAPESLLKKVEELCPKAEFLEGYGLSECSPILTLNIPNQPHQGVGPPLDGVEILIVHPESGEKMPIGKDGQVLGRGPNVFKGYLGNNVKSPFVEIDQKQWFQTGDLGHLDERGYLTLVGRLKRQIKIGGEMVNLNALEDGLIKKITEDGRLKSCSKDDPCFALSSKEENERSRIYLFTTIEIGLDEVNNMIKQLGFSNLHRIHRIEKLDKLPLMGNGKIHYRQLEDLLNKPR